MNTNHLEQTFLRIPPLRPRIDVPLIDTSIRTDTTDPIPQSVGYSKQPVKPTCVCKEEQTCDENKNTSFMSICL